jgi:hypothetical protein
MSRRLGLLGPLIVLVGAVGAGVGSWWMVTARPKAIAFLDVIALDAEAAVAVRRSDDQERSFVELRHFSGEVGWQALVPPYAGRPGAPGIAVSRDALSVRVVRDGHAEVFGMSMRNAAKLGGLKLGAARPPHPHGHTLPAAVTLTDQRLSFELLGQEETPAWAALVAIDLATGRERWNVDLGPEPVRSAGVVASEGGAVWVQQGSRVHGFTTADGVPVPVSATPPDDRAPLRVLLDDGRRRVEFDRKARALRVLEAGEVTAKMPWPPRAAEPWPYHLAGDRLWIVSQAELISLTLEELRRTYPETP